MALQLNNADQFQSQEERVKQIQRALPEVEQSLIECGQAYPEPFCGPTEQGEER